MISAGKKYIREFRQEAARLVFEPEHPIAHVTEEVGVSATILERWVKMERERKALPRAAAIRTNGLKMPGCLVSWLTARPGRNGALRNWIRSVPAALQISRIIN